MNPATSRKNYIILLVLMMGFWLLLSGHYDLFHVAMGVVAVGIVVWLDRKLLRERFFPPHSTIPPTLQVGRLHYYYFPWLVWQIISSSLHVAWVILSPRMPMNISVLRFKTTLPTNSGKVILGNSITLTPGTLTIDLSGDEFLVHSLTDTSSAGLRSGDFPAHTGRLYGLDPDTVVTEMNIIRSADEL